MAGVDKPGVQPGPASTSSSQSGGGPEPGAETNHRRTIVSSVAAADEHAESFVLRADCITVVVSVVRTRRLFITVPADVDKRAVPVPGCAVPNE